MLKNCLYGPMEVGIDEAGRGCLAGPVFAAAVILPHDFHNPLLNDSKQLSAKQRAEMRGIIEQEAIVWAVVQVSPQEIDRINILSATFKAMNLAVGQLKESPSCLLVDGNRFRNDTEIEYHCIVGGDSKYASIAAASVLAKTHRDEYMENIAKEYPQYGWEVNKGYPTKQHRLAILKYGVTKHHRLSFSGCQPQLF